VSEPTRVLLCDAQTSGGLLLAVPPERADALIAALKKERTPAAARIGRVTAGAPGTIAVA
jgi:selenide,water dikinase